MKKKVGMIAYTTYPFDARVRREAESLHANGYRVVFLAPKESNTPRKYYMDGVYVVELRKGKYQGKSRLRYMLSYFGFFLNAFLVGSVMFSRRGFEIIHVHNMPNFLVFAAVIPRLLGKKVVLDIHDTMPEMYVAKYEDAPGFLYRLFCLEEAICCRLAHKIICVNHVQRDAIVERGIPMEKIGIAMNVPDPRRFHARTNGRGEHTPSRGLRLVYHGTLAKRLGIDLIIEAVARLRDRLPGLEFHVIGGGDDVEEFKDLSRRLGVEKRVCFRRFVPIESVEKMISGMDVGVVGNRKNPASDMMLPVKILEYVALDIPIIAPRLKTIEHYFSDDMVSYYDAEDVDSLIGRIEEIYSNRDLGVENAKRARSFLKRYGWESHEEDFLDIYRSLNGGLNR